MQDSPYTIEFEDSWLIAAAKARGLPTQPGRDSHKDLLSQLQQCFEQELYPVHRIDQPASGLVLFARDAATAASMSALFRDGEVTRRYLAVVGREPEPAAATLNHLIRFDKRRNLSRVVSEGGKKATMHYVVAGASERYWLLDIRIDTGRHHQIRAQLSAVGNPIRGDLKYRARRSLPGGGIDLHAWQLAFNHPRTGNHVLITAPPPGDTLWKALTGNLSP